MLRKLISVLLSYFDLYDPKLILDFGTHCLSLMRDKPKGNSFQLSRSLLDNDIKGLFNVGCFKSFFFSFYFSQFFFIINFACFFFRVNLKKLHSHFVLLNLSLSSKQVCSYVIIFCYKLGNLPNTGEFCLVYIFVQTELKWKGT